MLRELAEGDMDAIFQSGLHEFLAGFLARNNRLGCEIASTYHFTDDTPFLQIGEHKYGKPIIDRVVEPNMRLGEAAKLALLSFDSTLRSNLSVGLPIDLLIYERDSLDVRREKRIEADDEYFR
jgi:predicted proteasome-type protease